MPRAMDTCDVKHAERPEDSKDPTRPLKDLIKGVLLIRSLTMEPQLVGHAKRHWSGSSQTEA